MTYYPDTREKYETNLRTGEKKGINYYWEGFLSADDRAKILVIDHIVQSIDNAIEEFKDGCDYDFETKVADKLKEEIMDSVEADRNILIVSMIDSMPNEEYDANFKEIIGHAPGEPESDEKEKGNGGQGND